MFNFNALLPLVDDVFLALYKAKENGGSIIGSTSKYMAYGGGTLGGTYGALSSNGDPQATATGAGIGAVAGATVVPGALIAGKLGLKAIPPLAKLAGKGALGASRLAGEGIIRGGASLIEKTVTSARSFAAGPAPTRMAARTMGAIDRVAGGLLKFEDGKEGGFNLKVTRKGKMVGGLAIGAYALSQMKGALEESRMGISDGVLTSATPSMDGYKAARQPGLGAFDNAGADGSLVFALNDLRQGGQL